MNNNFNGNAHFILIICAELISYINQNIAIIKTINDYINYYDYNKSPQKCRNDHYEP